MVNQGLICEVVWAGHSRYELYVVTLVLPSPDVRWSREIAQPSTATAVIHFYVGKFVWMYLGTTVE